MKSYNNIILLLSLMLALFSSCSKSFLEESLLTGNSSENKYSTVDGLESLVAGCYVTTKIWYGQEYGWDFSTAGTDIYDYGQQHPQQYQYTFTRDFNASNSRLVVLWTEFYRGINACNDAISVLEGRRDKIPNPFTEAHTKVRLAEVKYLRALYNYLIVETWGGKAVLRTEPVLSALTTSQNSTQAEFYEVIESDLAFAVENLTASDNVESADYGRVTLMAAKGLLARICLTQASYQNSTEYYTKAAQYANEVITEGNFPMYDSYSELWKLSNSMNNNSEAIWAVNYSRTIFAQMGIPEDEYKIYQNPGDKPWGDRDGGHHGHLMFGIQYDVMPGMVRDVENGRPFRRYFPTKYLIDSYNQDLDQRFDGTFKSTWFVNNADAGRYNVANTKEDINGVTTYIYSTRYENLLGESVLYDSLHFVSTGNVATWFKGPAFIRDDTDKMNRPPKKANEGILLFNSEGDTSIHMIKGEFEDKDQLVNVSAGYYWHATRHFWCLDYSNMYNTDGTVNDGGTNTRNVGFELHKFYDNEREAATGTGSERGVRDAIVMRIPEMYLIAAEAEWKTGSGDPYAKVLAIANKRAKTGVTGAELLASYGISSSADLSIDFFLNERAREFAGEQMRWFDLKRTGTFVDRMQRFAGNQQARANVNTDFTVRPIPESQFSFISNEDEFLQNTGY